MKKLHKIANFQNFQKSLLNFAPLHGVVIWCKFQLMWTKIEGADTFGVKYLKMSILSLFCKRSYQNWEFQTAITFEQKLILIFRKKLLEISQINPTWIFWPGPPIALKKALPPSFFFSALVNPAHPVCIQLSHTQQAIQLSFLSFAVVLALIFLVFLSFFGVWPLLVYR